VIINTVVEALKKDEREIRNLAIDIHNKHIEEKNIDVSSVHFNIFLRAFTTGFSAALKFDEE